MARIEWRLGSYSIPSWDRLCGFFASDLGDDGECEVDTGRYPTSSEHIPISDNACFFKSGTDQREQIRVRPMGRRSTSLEYLHFK